MRETEGEQATDLAFLQKVKPTEALESDVQESSEGISFYNPPSAIQGSRHRACNQAISDCMTKLVMNTPPGPERSKAISALREARMWANSGIALARDEDLSAAATERTDA